MSELYEQLPSDFQKIQSDSALDLNANDSFFSLQGMQRSSQLKHNGKFQKKWRQTAYLDLSTLALFDGKVGHGDQETVDFDLLRNIEGGNELESKSAARAQSVSDQTRTDRAKHNKKVILHIISENGRAQEDHDANRKLHMRVFKKCQTAINTQKTRLGGKGLVNKLRMA